MHSQQPFFACINLLAPHESRIRAPKEKFETEIARLRTEDRHDPAQAPLPPYYPDTPEVRRDVANYYDLVTAVDYQVGDILNELERQKVAGNTIVFFFGDHGRGLPRAKRWVYDSGIHVPLLVRWPRHIKPGTVREELVSLIDFAPSVLALARAEIPKAMQGQVFLGPDVVSERKYVFAARDRMDEAFDRIRAVRDNRYKYIRNFHPELPYAQRIAYLEEMPTMQLWRRWHAEGRLHGPQQHFFAATKPAEELYDLDTDPHEINNLADSPDHREKLVELQGALDQWMEESKDLGVVPETELIHRGLVKNVQKGYEQRKTIA
jgi:N-sulfoglucosamine sulfohydrolase